MASCCTCSGPGKGNAESSSLPLICLVPRDHAQANPASGPQGQPRPKASGATAKDNITLLDENYLRKHFSLPPRQLYLDPFRRPLITFPMTQEIVANFNLYRKTKINQQILDGFLDPGEAIMGQSVFPYAKNEADKGKDGAEDDEEIIYILQLPDWEYQCPAHNQTIKTPRFIWHSCKKTKGSGKPAEPKRGGGPLNKPKPWLLSRHTDFDLLSQW